MPRTYKPVQNKKRPYQSCSQENLQLAAEAVREGRMSQRKACEQFSVKKTTLVDFIRKGAKPVGRPTLLIKTEEKVIADLVDKVAEWGFPVGAWEVRLMAKDILDAKGVTTGTPNNIPGEDWFYGFKERNKMSKRAAANIRRARAGVDAEDVNSFFDEVQDMLQKAGVDVSNLRPDQVFNYDETNFVNNTGKSWAIVRRGRKRVEKVGDDSKQAFSTMWCGSASGEWLPPMVVYKAKHCYEGWSSKGPRGALYESTQSGWFDSKAFTRWFKEIYVPWVDGKEGPFWLFGDNLGSHFDAECVALVKSKNIYFMMLIANATHFIQPLDVSVFAPLKKLWRETLKWWRTTTKRVGDIPKEVFPSLLRQLCNRVEESVADNLRSGFRKCGLFPLDRNEVLKQLPSDESDITLSESETSAVLNNTLVEMLKENRGLSNSEKLRRGKKVKQYEGLKDIIAGRALELEDEEEDEYIVEFEEEDIIEEESEEEEEEEEEEEDIDETDFQIAGMSGVYSRYNELCGICKEGDDVVFSDDSDSDDDGGLNWTGCDECDRWYHDRCLAKRGLKERGLSCIYCSDD